MLKFEAQVPPCVAGPPLKKVQVPRATKVPPYEKGVTYYEAQVPPYQAYFLPHEAHIRGAFISLHMFLFLTVNNYIRFYLAKQ